MKYQLLLLFLLCSVLLTGQNSDAELFEQKTDIVIDKGKLTKSYSFLIRINNRNGEDYTKISIPFSKISKISKLEASVLNQNCKLVRKLKNSEITERSYISNHSFYEDDYLKEFTLRHNVYPYFISYSYQIQESDFFTIENWIPILDSGIATRNAELTLTVPNDYVIHYRNTEIEPPIVEQNSGKKTTVYKWKASYTTPIKRESLAPVAYRFMPSVYIVAEQFKFHHKGSLASWDDFNKWIFKLNKGTDVLPESEKQIISSLIVGEKDTVNIIRKLYHYLQDNTRYVNIAIDKGGLKSYPASYVCNNKFGDCKALTNYMKAMLNYVGIKSYYTLVHAGNPIKEIFRDFPSQQFNHVILFVPMQNDTIWLDCTSKGAFNNLGTFSQNRDAFIVDDKIGGFVRTPAHSSEQVAETRIIVVDQPENGTSTLSFKQTIRGEKFEELLSIQTSYSENDKAYIFRNYIVEDNVEANQYEINHADRDAKVMQLEYEGISKHFYKKYGNEYVINNIPFKLPTLSKPEERKLPVQIDFPTNKTDTVYYKIPDGYELSSNPEDFSVENEFGKYSIAFIQIDNQIRVIKSFLLYSGNYELNRYKDFHDFITLVLNKEKIKHITFKLKKENL